MQLSYHERDGQVLNQELEEASNVLRSKRNEVQRIEEEVALLMQVSRVTAFLLF